MSPNVMRVADTPTANPLPVIVTAVPPAGGPVFGLTLVTVGVNSNVSFDEMGLVPCFVVTLTSTFPAVAPGGDTAVIEVGECTVKLVAFVEPNRTALACLKWVPPMVTTVPPVAGPPPGVTLVTVGSLPAYAGATLPVIA